MTPKVTVLTCVYNGLPYLKDAIDSTLNQTYSDFEYLIIDDASPDPNVCKLIESYSDSRIKFNLPNRIEEQISYLENNPSIDIVCSWEHTIDSNGKKIKSWKRVFDNYGDFLGYVLIGICPIWHPSIAFKSNIMVEAGGFNKNYTRAEDFEVTARLAILRYGAAIVPKFHLLQREHNSSQSSEFAVAQAEVCRRIHAETITNFIKYSNQELLANFLTFKLKENKIKISKDNLIEIHAAMNELFTNINTKQNLTNSELQSIKRLVYRRVGYGVFAAPIITKLPSILFYLAYYILSPFQLNNLSAGGQASSLLKDGFIFDEGIHVMHTKNEYILSLMELLDVDMEVRERNAWIMSNDVLTRYPFQANTFGLPKEIIQDCVDGFINNSFVDSKNINSYEDWIYYMFGKGIAEHFMIRYPKNGGYGFIGERLAEKCKGNINVGMEATSIDTYKKEIEFNHDHVVSYNKLLSSIPLPELIKIIPNVPSEVKLASSKLKTNSMFVVNIGVNRANITDKNWIYFLEKKYSFVRVSFPFNQSDNVAPKGTSSISAEIAYGNDNPLPMEKHKLIEHVINELISIGILKNDDEIIHKSSVDIKYAYVIFDKTRKSALKTIHDYLKAYDIVPFGRYGLWAYLWSDEAILSGKKVAEKIKKI